MFNNERKMMQKISNYCGERVDYVQGGGGNTSVKFDEQLMAIKASGYTLAETTTDRGFITVDFQKIKEYYNNVDPSADKDFEKESLSVNMSSIVLLDGMEEKRPSVEVGMHSFLQRCVIHTHSVYANMMCCAEKSKQIAQEAFKRSDIKYLFVPYIDPGFRLTLAVKKAVDDFAEKNNCMPDAIFMENHGVITTNDDADRAIELHEQVNELLKQHFGLGEYPKPSVKKTEDGFESDTKYLLQFSKKHGGKEYFENLLLYPDQLVYITKSLDDVIKFEGDRIEYKASAKQAQVIEETMLAVAFVVNEIEKAGLTLRQMTQKAADFIFGWESEKYRSKMVK